MIGNKWVFKNKSDEHGTATRNKAMLVSQEYAQIEGVDFNEIFAPIAKLAAIKLLLGIFCLLKFKMDVLDGC